MRSFLSALFQSSAERHTEAVTAFRKHDFTPDEADQAAREIWLACRTGMKTPQWIIDRVNWQGVYPGMCQAPDACRGRSSCPRDTACDH